MECVQRGQLRDDCSFVVGRRSRVDPIFAIHLPQCGLEGCVAFPLGRRHRLPVIVGIKHNRALRVWRFDLPKHDRRCARCSQLPRLHAPLLQHGNKRIRIPLNVLRVTRNIGNCK
jgi:hypothetical protein